MGRMTRKLSVVALILLGAGVAAAQTSFMNPVGPSVNGIAQSTTTNAASASTATPLIAQTTVSPSGSAVAIDQIVSVARTVDAGAPVTVFTVPAGFRLVVTDIIITNPSSAPICGASVMPGGAGASTTTGGTTTGTTATTTAGGSTTTTAAPVESGTGMLCVPAQTSMSLGLTTGLEFTPGQSVLLSNQSTTTAATTTPTTTTPTTTTAGATPTPTTASGQLLYHLRGFLVTGA